MYKKLLKGELMSRKIITQNELAKIKEKYESEKQQLISSILAQARQVQGDTVERAAFGESEEKIADQSKIEDMISKLGPKPAEKSDSYSDRLMKYIPTEVIALYLTFDTIIRSSSGGSTSSNLIYWIIFFFCFIGTILYFIRMEKVRSVVQIIISVGAFAVWVFALGGPFLEFSWYNTLYGALLLPAYTFLIPLIEPEQTKE